MLICLWAVKFCFRLVASETVQFFQFDDSGNMYIFPAGSGCNGIPRRVEPGDECIFNDKGEESQEFSMERSEVVTFQLVTQNDASSHVVEMRARSFKQPLESGVLDDLSHKNFAPDTMKKIKWVTKMYREWRNYRHSLPDMHFIECDLDDKDTITKESLMFALCRFLTEVKKVDGTNFPGKTLYEILICVQFHLETLGFAFKLLNDEHFKDVKYTLDNVMKLRTAEGVGKPVRQAEVLSESHEEYLWRIGLLGINDPDTLLNTVIFIIGKGFSLRAGKEHYSLRRPPYNSQFTFLHDEDGQVFLRYHEAAGLKTNKGGLKHMKIEPKCVDLYPISDISRCPVRIIMLYLSKLPRGGTCKAFYLQPRKKYLPNSWYQNRCAGQNKLRDCIKDMCSKAGFPGFFTNHSLRSTAATKMYRSDIDEQLIMEITGHRSLAVRSYKRTCNAQHKKASNSVFGQ